MFRRLGRVVRQSDLENRSITAMITVLSTDMGMFVKKSMVKCVHGCCGMDKGTRILTGRIWGTLAWVHAVYEEMNMWVSESMNGHQYFSWGSWCVLLVPGYPGVLWTRMIWESKVEFWEKEHPPWLSWIQSFGSLYILLAIEECVDQEWMFSILQHQLHSQECPAADVIITFCRG